MFTEGVVVMILCVVRAFVHCTSNQNDTQLNDDFIRKCCFDDTDTINDGDNCYYFKELNHTLTMISYGSHGNMSEMCCTTCFENTIVADVSGEDGRRGGNKHECVNEGTRPNTTQYCSKACLSNGETLRVWRKWNSNESDEVFKSCIKNNDFDENRTGTELQHKYCDSLLSSLNFWGANIVVFANIIYIVPYLTVVIAYFAIPGLGGRAYNKAVICYNATQIALNGILIGIGSFVLCHVSIHPTVFTYFGLIIMFLTISSTFWLFVVCIDMTSVITRFRWTSPTNTNKEQERKKFVTYAAWTMGGSLLPTALACIAELSPLLGESSPARPNFDKFNEGANLPVILYVATFPALTCLANTALFCYTSYKMIQIQKSTKLATANNNKLTINTVRKRYFLFLRLYLLMDAPWVTSALAAAFTELWVLKFLRMIQPFLMLLAILPPGTITRVFACNCSNRKSDGEIQARLSMLFISVTLLLPRTSQNRNRSDRSLKLRKLRAGCHATPSSTYF